MRQRAGAVKENQHQQAGAFQKIMNDEIYLTYPHNPPHLFLANASYMVTAGAFQKEHYFQSPDIRKLICQILFDMSERFEWQLEAWAVLANHYHFIARAPKDAGTLVGFIKALHSKTAIEMRKRSGITGKIIWQNYWDTCLTYEKSYLSRLSYVHFNPVKHGLVEKAENYPFCSAKWFMEGSPNEWREKILKAPCDRIKVDDDF
ncbi:MAG: transposase [Proteobacteria bacterium]|nr:transposase [Pseudomonadota bacterium]